MYSSARRSVVPLWLAHPRDQLGEDQRGDELALLVAEVRRGDDRAARLAVRRAAASSRCRAAGRVIHAPNDGDASRPLSRIANAVRSFGGKNWSSSNTPSLRIGGCCTMPDQASARSRLRPAVHSLGIRFDSRMCSRLDSGSASMPTRLEQAADEAFDLVADHLGVAGVRRGLQRADDVQPDAGRRSPACRS